jgi:hypothetical protein
VYVTEVQGDGLERQVYLSGHQIVEFLT